MIIAPHRRAGSRWILAALALIVLLLVGNKELVSGKAAPQWDATDFFGPQLTLVGDHVRSHHILLWDPWVAAGTPDFAEPEFAVSSPLALFLGAVVHTPERLLVTYWFVLWAFGAVGCLLLCRYIGASVLASTIIAAAFVSCGFFTGHAEHISSICSAAYLPWILWRFDAALSRRNLWFAVQSGILYGMSCLGGYPEGNMLTGMFLVLWALGKLMIAARPTMAQLGRCITACLIVFGLCGAVCSPVYFGILKETRGFSDRVGPRSRAEAVSSQELKASASATLMSPYLPTLNLTPRQPWAPTDVSMCSIYVSGVVLLFGIAAALRRSAWNIYLFAVGVFFYLCSLGDQVPLRGWLYDYLPPTRYFRNPSIFSLYTLFVLCLLAAREFAAPVQRAKLWIVLTIAGCVGATLCFLYGLQLVPEHVSAFNAAVAQLILDWGVLLVLLIVLAMGKIRFASLLAGLCGVVFISVFLTFLISRPVMYSSGSLPLWDYMAQHHDRSIYLGAPGLNRQFRPAAVLGPEQLNDNVVQKVPVLSSYSTMTNSLYERLIADPVAQQMALGSDRMWFSSHPLWAAATQQQLTEFLDAYHATGKPSLILHSPDAMASLGHAQSTAPAASRNLQTAQCDHAPIDNVIYGPNALIFEYNAPSDGWLMVTDRWAADWRVSDNGESRDNVAADFAFRAIRVKKGRNNIAYRYRPRMFAPLLALSWLLLAGFAVAEVFRSVRRRVARTRATGNVSASGALHTS